jgi:hypothetical protein
VNGLRDHPVIAIIIQNRPRGLKTHDFPEPVRYSLNRAANPDAWTPELLFDRYK